MKEQDVAIVLIIVFVAGVGSFFLANKFIAPSTEKRKAESVAEITADFELPSSEYFNAQSVNPTPRIEIAPNENGQPFTNATN